MSAWKIWSGDVFITQGGASQYISVNSSCHNTVVVRHRLCVHALYSIHFFSFR